MKLSVVGAAESWYLQDLTRAAGSRHQVTGVRFTQLQAQLAGETSDVREGEQSLRTADAVLVRSMPPGSLEHVVFRMNALAELERCGTLVVNPPRSLEVAIDKYLASAMLARAGLTVPETIVCQTAADAMAAFEQLGGDVVVKPIFGSEGRGITRCSDIQMMLRCGKMLQQLQAAIYVQRFVDHEGFDYRLLLVGDEVFGMRRVNQNDWRTNVACGATTEPLSVTDDLERIARTAVAAIGAPLAAVDILPGKDGVLYALEVNAVPGWKALARVLNVDIADVVFSYLQKELG